MGRICVLLFDPALGQHVFFFGLQQRKLADFLKVAVQPAFWCRCGQVCIICHLGVPPNV